LAAAEPFCLLWGITFISSQRHGPGGSVDGFLGLRRFFGFEGRLGGLRYRARVGILTLSELESVPGGSDIATAADAGLLNGCNAIERSSGVEQNVWESEGGAIRP
jgi:hypothetical protein